MSLRVTLLIVEKNGNIKTVNVKEYNESELYKKCGFKIADGFSRQYEWKTKLNGQKMVIHMYGKSDGRANTENKYEFPPPIDNKLLFGNCILVGMVKSDDGALGYINLTIELWTAIYEKLFGGFDDLCEEEESEEEVIPEHFKTKEGYSKEDGFIVDDEEEDEDFVCPSEEESCEDTESGDEDDDDDDDDAKYGCETDEEELNEDDDDDDDELSDDDPTSELSEEEYSY